MPDSAIGRERELLDQKEVYRQILDAISDMVLVKGAESRILWANKAFRDYYDMSNDQLRDLIDATFNEVDYTKQYVLDDHQVYSTGQVLDIPEEPVTRHDGLVQIFNTVKSPLRDHEGRVLMTVGVSRNITESKRAKEDLARYREHLERLVDERTNELSRLSTNLSTILSSLVEGIVATDGQGLTQLVNPAAASLLGLSPNEALGKLVHEQIDFSPEQGEKPGRALLEVLLANARPLTGHVLAHDGKQRLVSIQAAPLKGAEATTGTVLVVCQNLAAQILRDFCRLVGAFEHTRQPGRLGQKHELRPLSLLRLDGSRLDPSQPAERSRVPARREPRSSGTARPAPAALYERSAPNAGRQSEGPRPSWPSGYRAHRHA